MIDEPRGNGDDVQAAAERLLADLRAEVTDADLQQDELDDWESPENVQALRALDSEAFAPEVHLAVDSLLQPGESISPTSRQRMVSAAERAIRWRRAVAATLPVALRAQRELARKSTEAVAMAIAVEAQLVSAVELGKIEIRSLQPRQVAAWITTVDLAPQRALAALERSLSLRVGDAVYAARQSTGETATPEARQFYDEVASLLQH